MKKNASKQTTTLAVTGDRFLVRYEKRDSKKSPGGIFMPDNVKEERTHGTITAIVIGAGPGRLCDDGIFRRSVDAEAGARLMLDSVHTAWWIEDQENPGERLHFINATDALAVLA